VIRLRAARSSRLAVAALIPLILVLLVSIAGSVAADGGFLYGRYGLGEPTRIDLSQLAASKRFYIFPRELVGGSRSLPYYLRPQRALVIMPGTPTVVIEMYAKTTLDQLLEAHLKELRSQMSRLNQTKNLLAKREEHLAELGASFNRQASALSTMQAQSEDADVAPLRSAYQKLARTLQEFIQTTRELSSYEAQMNREELNYEAARLRLAVLLNQSEVGRAHSLLSLKTPDDLVKQAQERLSKLREGKSRLMDAATKRVKELTAQRTPLLNAAFAFSQPVEPELLLSALANRITDFQPAAFAHPHEFAAFARNEFELARAQEESRVLASGLLDVATADALLSREASALTRLPSVTATTQQLRVPASMEGITRRLAMTSASWSQAQWKSFLRGLARSFSGRSGARVPVPPRGGTFSGSDYMNLAQLEIPALLAALEGLDASSPSLSASASSSSANPSDSPAAPMTWDALLRLAEEGLAAARASAAASPSTAASASTFGVSGEIAPASPAELTFWEICVFLARELGRTTLQEDETD